MSPPPPAGEVVKYSSLMSDHIVPSQDVQGFTVQRLKMLMTHKRLTHYDSVTLPRQLSRTRRMVFLSEAQKEEN